MRRWPLCRAGHQAPDRVGIEPRTRQVGDDRAAEHHDDALAELPQLVEVLGDQQHAAARCSEAEASAADELRRAYVEATRRVGGDEQPATDPPRASNGTRLRSTPARRPYPDACSKEQTSELPSLIYLKSSSLRETTQSMTLRK